MGNYILCRRELAKLPYHIESVQLNIYSIEELCYFIANFLPLADQSVINNDLFAWLYSECKVKEANDISGEIRTDDDVYNAIMWIVKNAYYFTNIQIEKLDERLKEHTAKRYIDKKMERGDILMTQKKYRSAITDYLDILDTEGILSQSREFLYKVYYNLGCAYAKLFRLDKARDCFKKAYDVNPCEQVTVTALRAAYLDGDKEAFLAEASYLNASDEEKETVIKDIESIETPDITENLNVLVKQWVGEYHESMGL